MPATSRSYKGQMCVVDGCDRVATERSRCHAHYEFLRRTGKDRPGRIPRRSSPLERLMAKVVPTQGPLSDTHGHCWIWTGSTDGAGRYGGIGYQGKIWRTHRLAYVLLLGPLDDGHELDHLCRTTLCCNPSHLEPVTHRVNVHRGKSIQAVNGAKTHCHRGHELAGENLRIRVSDGGRICLACERINYERRQAKIRSGEIPRRGGQRGRPRGQSAR